jgi:hypothetical protein
MSREDVLAVIRRVIKERMDHRVTHLDELADLLEKRANAHDSALAALTRFRTSIVSLPQLVVGSTDVAVSWATPFSAADYGVVAMVEAGTNALSKLNAGLKTGTRTTSGCVITVTNSALVSIQAGNQLHVLGWRTPS